MADEESLTYRDTRVAGNARAIVGNVYNTHKHYHGKRDHPRSGRKLLMQSAHSDTDLQISTTCNDISPDSISDYDAEWALWLRREQRLPNTCEWIARVKEYKSWLSGRGPPILFCTGSVGCGKSVTACAVYDSLAAEHDSPGKLLLSYFFPPAQNQKTTAGDVIRALIKQLLVFHRKIQTNLPQDLKDTLWHTFSRGRGMCTVSSLTRIFDALTRDIENCTLILDGLDLLKESDVLEFFRFVRNIFPEARSISPSFKMILFCRETLGRGIRLENLSKSTTLQIGLDHVEHDIHSYVDHVVPSKQRERSITNDPNLVKEIVNVLKSNSARMFLWVKLQVESIWDPNFSTSDGHIRRQLMSLPRNLDETYVLCLRRIQETNIELSRDIAPKVFRWVALASRPLTPTEAQELVSMDCNNGPLTTKDQILGLPVMDYCANLVIHNRFANQVEFAHPTVRDFLTDEQKLPDELKHFLVVDDMRCGHLCLKYVEQHRSKNRIVQVKKQQIGTNVTTPVLRSVSENLLSSRWFRTPFFTHASSIKNDGSVRLALPAPKSRQTILTDSAVHDYICRNWLWHTSDIESAVDSAVPGESSTSHLQQDFERFKDLCLCHDMEIQPWSDSQTRGVSHYERLIVYATMTDHVALLHVATEHVKRHKTLRSIFEHPCAGTDSSLLHVAAALGHVRIAEELLKVCPHDYANREGKSAAAIAVECHQNEVFPLFVTGSVAGHTFTNPVLRQLRHFQNSAPVFENILDVCAIVGNLEATEIVLRAIEAKKSRYSTFSVDGRLGKEQYWFCLSSSMFKACQNDHIDVATLLVAKGAKPDYYFDDNSIELHLKPEDSSLRQALILEDAALFERLLSIGAELKPDAFHPDVFEVINHFKDDMRKVDPFIAALARHGGFQCDHAEHIEQSSSWLERMIQEMLLCSDGDLCHWNRFLRSISDNTKLSAGTKPLLHLEGFLPWSQLQTRLPGIEASDGHLMIEAWLQRIPDDILIRIFRYRWIRIGYLFSAGCLRALARRGTSRALEVLFESIEISCVPTNSFDSQCFYPRYVAPAIGSPVNVDWDFGRVDWDFGRVAVVESGHPRWDMLPPAVMDTARGTSMHENCPMDGRDFCVLQQTIMKEALIGRHEQIVEVLACRFPTEREYLARLITDINKDRTSVSVKKRSGNGEYLVGFGEDDKEVEYLGRFYVLLPEAIRNFSFSPNRHHLNMLMWVRCFSKAEGDAEAADNLYASLAEVKSDANFALNWPAGYVSKYPLQRISENILLGLYAWNYRLRRRKKQPFSVADIWYLGLKMAICILKDNEALRRRPPSSLYANANSDSESEVL